MSTLGTFTCFSDLSAEEYHSKNQAAKGFVFQVTMTSSCWLVPGLHKLYFGVVDRNIFWGERKRSSFSAKSLDTLGKNSSPFSYVSVLLQRCQLFFQYFFEPAKQYQLGEWEKGRFSPLFLRETADITGDLSPRMDKQDSR